MAAKKQAAKKPAAKKAKSGGAKAIKRVTPGTRMSQAVVAGGLVFLAGQVSRSGGETVADQTRAILSQIDELLKQAGTSKERLVSANIWLTDIATWAEMNSVWDTWVPANSGPARATVEAKLAAPQYKVEIAVVAALG
jgi:enamine deaminase RidA (YjgF/YER057c/UK114 family)